MAKFEVKTEKGSLTGPLHGVKVVCCSTAQAGTVPYMLMADLGADVIKIEVPSGGDKSRNQGIVPGYPSSYFETNKYLLLYHYHSKRIHSLYFIHYNQRNVNEVRLDQIKAV